jgi:hypothetical protein
MIVVCGLALGLVPGAVATTATLKLNKCEQAILHARHVHPKLLRTAPPTGLTSILGVLRQPSTPSDILPKGARPTSDYSVLWINYVRLLATVGSARYFLIPGIYADPLPAACRAQLSARARREYAQADRDQRHGSASLEVFDRTPGGNESAIPFPKPAIERGVLEIFPAPGASRAPAYGIVPDGVSTVTIAGRTGQVVRAAVSDNFFRAHVPVSLRGNSKTGKTEVFTARWYAADGKLLKTFSIELHSLSGTV